MEAAGITVNKNTIPYDTNSPMITSGIRLGTPALTSRGMRETEMATIGEYIGDVLDDIQNEALQTEVRARVTTLAKQFPLYELRI